MALGELGKLEQEQRTMREELERLNEREAPLAEIREATRRFMENWSGVGELLEQATREEQAVILQHYIEVIELKPADSNGKIGTYALKLFPEVSPLDGPTTRNKITTDPDDGGNDGVLTNSTMVRRVGEKAPYFILSSDRLSASGESPCILISMGSDNAPGVFTGLRPRLR